MRNPKKMEAVEGMKSTLTVKYRSTRHRQIKFTEHESSFWNLGLEQVVKNELVDVGTC